MSRRLLTAALLWACTWACGPAAAADAYPSHPIHWIVPYPPGGTTDVIARTIAQQMSQRLGVAIVVENRGGAGGTIGIGFVARSEPDGYTLLVSDASVATAPSLYRTLAFDVAKDLVPVERFATVPHVVVVNPALPVHTVAELVKYSNTAPNRLDFASGGIGSPLHLAGEAFRAATGVTWTHVPYRGAGPAILAAVTGEAQVAVPSLPSALPQITGQRLRALAVTSAKRVASLPDVPSVAELGFPNAVAVGWIGLHARAGTPAAVVAQLQQAAAEALNTSAVRDVLRAQGADIEPLDSADYGRFVAAETLRWKRLVEAAGIQPQ